MYSKEFQITFMLAFKTAQQYRHEFVLPEHILFALLHDPESKNVNNLMGKEASKSTKKTRRYSPEANLGNMAGSENENITNMLMMMSGGMNMPSQNKKDDQEEISRLVGQLQMQIPDTKQKTDQKIKVERGRSHERNKQKDHGISKQDM